MLEVPVEFLHERLILDAITGELRWKPVPEFGATWNARYAGKPAGTVNDRYVDVSLLYNGKKRIFKAHRIVFAMLHGRWPENELDHANRASSHNAPLNLREATRHPFFQK